MTTELLFPTNFSLHDLDECVQGSKDFNRKKNQIRLFIHYLLTRMIQANGSGGNPVDYVQIPQPLVRKILGNDYRMVIAAMKAKGLVKTEDYTKYNYDTYEGIIKPYFSKNRGICISYRIVAHSVTKHDISDNIQLMCKAQELRRLSIPDEEIFKWLNSCIDKLQIRDDEEALEAFRQFFAERYVQYITAETFIQYFNSNSTHLLIDDFGLRFHAKLAVLKKVFRRHLIFINHPKQQLVNIDCVNSQPLIYSIANSKTIKLLVPECMEAADIFRRSENEESFIRYREDCFKGIVYERVIDQWMQQYSQAISRDMAKKVFLIAAYDCYKKSKDLDKKVKRIVDKKLPAHPEGNRQARRNFSLLAFKVYKELYPALWDINFEIKKLDWSHLGANPMKPHSSNCLLAQRLESAVLLRLVGAELMKNGITCGTIHDSFMVPAKYTDKVAGIIRKVFKKLGVNTPPPLEVEDFSEKDKSEKRYQWK
ncbi:hypothetical protein D770_05240 [Flammeovirgaceae bacterium 311]|nr:hypothetical protein D770_05240 [Flammeovirgaceae bacterium 311]